jgi:amidohydrolase
MALAGTTELLADANDLLDDSIALRRYLHERPELGLQLPNTQHRLMEELQSIGLAPQSSTTVSGITAIVEGEHDGPTILLRADMDALPLHEDVDVPFASKDHDKMHACGHDLHVSMLTGAAKLLQARRRELHGRVLLMFQPGEEGFHGARYMLDEGLLEKAGTVDRAFAIHVFSQAPSGVVAGRAGALMASSDTFSITVHGQGGHGSAPHQAIDPIQIACEIVQSLQIMVTRRIDVFDPAVVNVGKIEAGTASNIIPPTANILGTIRSVSERTRMRVQDGIKRVAENIAAAHEATAEVTITLGYPVTINNDHVAAESMRVAGELFGERRVAPMKAPVMGSEDWSYVLQKVPGAMLFLGATPHGKDPFSAEANHSNKVFFDEATMTTGMALYAGVALDHLKGGK